MAKTFPHCRRNHGCFSSGDYYCIRLASSNCSCFGIQTGRKSDKYLQNNCCHLWLATRIFTDNFDTCARTLGFTTSHPNQETQPTHSRDMDDTSPNNMALGPANHHFDSCHSAGHRQGAVQANTDSISYIIGADDDEARQSDLDYSRNQQNNYDGITIGPLAMIPPPKIGVIRTLVHDN